MPSPANPILMCVEPEFRESAHRVGDNAADFHEILQVNAFKDSLSIWSLLREPMSELPQVLGFDSRIDEAN
jgi:hypothetical protein